MAKVIVVPDVPREEAPTVKLCYKQAPTMVRCDRKLGHNGPHSWEAMEMIYSLEDQLRKLREAH